MIINITVNRSNPPEFFLGKGVLKTCITVTGENPCRSAISIKFLWNFVEIAVQQECSPVNFLHFFKTPFPKTTSRRLLLCELLTHKITSSEHSSEQKQYKQKQPFTVVL